MPVCAGADTVWRSASAGWEKLDTVTFADGRATVALDHYCDLAITGESIPLKGIGFVHPEGKNAQIVIMHVGCDLCEVLKRLSSDEDVLQPLRKCGPSVQLGTFQHNEELEIHQAGRTSKIKMRFDKMPLSRRLYAQSGLQFDVEIDGENRSFEAELVPGPATPAPQPAPHPSGHPAGSAPQAGRAIFVEAWLLLNDWKNMEKLYSSLDFICGSTWQVGTSRPISTRKRHAAASQVPAVAGAVGSSGVPNPGVTRRFLGGSFLERWW